MAGYLDQYGAGEERRGKIIKTVVISVLLLIVVGGSLLFVFHNYREERQVKEFFNQLGSHNYKAAYALFGCTEAKPCRYYPFDKFMEDWGPNSGRTGFENARITRSRSCGSGVLMTVDYGKNQQEKLWVERQDMSIGFPPVQGCPAGL
ncbi:MAG TPA: hypothetical protein VGF49_01180 [Candidatus Solibacter sp.]|jgi:hypothetical protein